MATGKALTPHSESWNAIQLRATTLYGTDATKRGGALHPATSIEEVFRFSAKDEDLTFRFQRAESLLDSSADLLERALSSRREWNDLQAKSFGIALSIQQYLEIDKIHDDETAAGYYTHSAFEAASLAYADGSARDDLLEQVSALDLIDKAYFDDATINQQTDAVQLMAILSKWASYDSESDNTSHSKLSWDSKPEDYVFKLAQDAAIVTSFRDLDMGHANLKNAEAATLRAAIAAGGRADASSSEKAWTAASVGFLQRRTEVARHLAEESIAAYTRQGGALNYPERMSRLRLLFNRDFRDALARLTVGAEGMKKIYGYKEAARTVTDS